ncbi:MAG TPA: PDZ domain-containing protein [Puia sp.]|uniref:S41 family peptidase n=1 Tax=Puia sp. TaxID=2045100 RepID=UPI002D010046|nr:PDZ domain-containing protein [Puia sp.]HVU99657.1 PDZ domain-containing protein [Puia sp.]
MIRNLFLLRMAIFVGLVVPLGGNAQAQGTRLLRQPTLSASLVAFVYGGDIWVADKNGGEARRITSTAATESDPHFSPDGKSIAFTSNRSGTTAVYVVSSEGGIPTRLTWYPAATFARGWTPDGKRVVYACSRETAPVGYNRLWSVPVEGGVSTLLPAPWGFDGSLSPDGKKMVVDRVSRWDVEFRHYRGGQNTPLTVLDLETLKETGIPGERTMDIHPVWQGDDIFFLSDRDFIMNVWAYSVGKGSLRQVTHLKEGDIKWLSGNGKELAYEHGGYLFVLDPASGASRQLDIRVHGDFPWAEPHWENVTSRATSATLSPTGKRILVEARGDIFTVPIENGNARNLTHSSDVADRAPSWSPDGKWIAWFSDKGGEGYALYLTDQEGKGEPRKISIGESKLAWEPCWSPDSKYIAFEDNKVRIKVIDAATGKITNVDAGGANIERGNMGLVWSPDSKWLAYAKTGLNNFRRVMVWSLATGKTAPLSDPLADATQPAWDRDARHLYFLASTDAALGSGWANTSSILARPSFAAYVVVLRKEDGPPFPLKSDDEEKKDSAAGGPKKDSVKKDSAAGGVRIDFENLDRRTVALPIAVANYRGMVAGPKGSVFILSGEGTLSRFVLDTKKFDEYGQHVNEVDVSANGEKLLMRSGGTFRVVATGKPPAPAEGTVAVNLRMNLDRLAEWKQIFTEGWRYERDYFYDPALHGRDWQEVWAYYSPMIPYIRHRSDLTYLLDQLGGELSVGHSFVFGGDFPSVDTLRVGLLGADLVASQGRWQIKRVYTAESWNPELKAPLAQPGLKVAEGDYILAVDGVSLSGEVDPYQLLDGKAGQQTTLLVNNKPSPEGAWSIRVEPVASESALRQRAWVEDNRRKVNELSGGKLGYVWVPNTGGPGFVSFNRYFFAQQDKYGAVIDERFNGGGNLDDYMVDLMIRRQRAAITNEVPDGAAFRLPAGILGPKVLLINELAGSGGDFFPWVFRHQKVGPLIGTRTWGGLVKSSVHYPFVDGGAMTAPDNAVFDPESHQWIAENQGVAPDIEVKVEAGAVSKGHDLQLERAVQECLRLLEKEPRGPTEHPAYSKPAKP